jgi:L-lactate utilization protein LutC
MTKKQLVKIIQEVVRREIKKEINEIFIREQKTSEPQLADVIQQKVSEPKEQVKYTNNKSLNDVLNETVGLSKKQDSEYPTMGGGTFDTSRMTELLGYGQTDEVKRDMVAVDTIKKAGRSVDQVPDHVTSALTKDYSALMKALDKKKQGGLG